MRKRFLIAQGSRGYAARPRVCRIVLSALLALLFESRSMLARHCRRSFGSSLSSVRRLGLLRAGLDALEPWLTTLADRIRLVELQVIDLRTQRWRRAE